MSYTQESINDVFTYHSPKDDQPSRYQTIREQGRVLAQLILDSCPAHSDRDKAIEKVREAVMWANASIAIHE
jgi:hypothetical protein